MSGSKKKKEPEWMDLGYIDEMIAECELKMARKRKICSCCGKQKQILVL